MSHSRIYIGPRALVKTGRCATVHSGFATEARATRSTKTSAATTTEGGREKWRFVLLLTAMNSRGILRSFAAYNHAQKHENH